MPRIPYQFPEPGVSAVADSIRERRNGELIKLDGVLLNAPSMAAGYSNLLRSVRLDNSLSADIREVLILRVAALNGATYEWIAHEPIARAAGINTLQLGVIRDVTTALTEHVDPTNLLSESCRTALVYADWMTKNVRVPQSVFDALKTHFSDQKIAEITVTVSTYNMVSRILVALDVGELAEVDVPQMDKA
ncbi:carboxymuconolactone decarboxylase [Trametopsis cervina]|nr:carboxymuconolactone decarboxylase [Trametopsis cervina]